MKNAFNNEILNSFSNINKMLYKLSKIDAEHNGLTVPQLKTLYKVSSSPNIGLVELAEYLKLTNSTVSGVVDRLVQQELLERHTPSHDRRAITIRLSKKGEEKLEQVVESESLLVKKLNEIAKLPKKDIEQLLSIHEQILTILKQ
ncbi:MarR family winged helix-turn-helix transcriptional regulator [Lederbergia wuyishanensis]|uniref:DNA-binding MarR family transcriptional regulator n=1 Tax=Lederbergia wuyishanensis TaxID=1347903 RepID=A0ABU0DAE3_9BACI|nr:MarR family transcriptional regulator [Lederbergia wuyishanensis]MCJ8010089.1 MarR family transcriptional regulator [Lederbergia wuyishanensis]MDQ0345328.1 DNA-binding MarR family transcriptional regulator [Lederbergia wuyishanensis]